MLHWHLAAPIKSASAVEPAFTARLVSELIQTPVIRECLQWFAREKQWINEQHLQLSRVPAPTFFEQKRAEWMLAQFRALGCVARIDRGGNVVAHPFASAYPGGGGTLGPAVTFGHVAAKSVLAEGGYPG